MGSMGGGGGVVGMRMPRKATVRFGQRAKVVRGRSEVLEVRGTSVGQR